MPSAVHDLGGRNGVRLLFQVFLDGFEGGDGQAFGQGQFRRRPQAGEGLVHVALGGPGLAGPGLRRGQLLPEQPVAGELVRERGVGEGLDQVLHHADGHGAPDDREFADGRDGDDVRQDPCGAHPPGDVQAVQVREVHVQQDKFHRLAGGRELRQEPERGLAVRGGAGQRESRHPAHVGCVRGRGHRFVLHHEDADIAHWNCSSLSVSGGHGRQEDMEAVLRPCL